MRFSAFTPAQVIKKCLVQGQILKILQEVGPVKKNVRVFGSGASGGLRCGSKAARGLVAEPRLLTNVQDFA